MGAGATNHVEVLPKLKQIKNDHGLLEDHERGQAAHAASIEGEEPDSFARHCGPYFKIPIDGRLRL